MRRICLVCIVPAMAMFGQTPRVWNETDLAGWATPLAGNLRPGHFSEAEYYRAPVDNFRTYPVYHPDREPPGYWEELKKRRPEPLIEPGKRRTQAEWIAAGKRIWYEMDVAAFRLFDEKTIRWARSREEIKKSGVFVQADGALFPYRWAVTPKGVALTISDCGACHTRHLDDGTPVAGPGFNKPILGPIIEMVMQGNAMFFPGDSPQMAFYRQFGVPWLKGDIHEKIKTMEMSEIGEIFEAEIPGVIDRFNGSPIYITKVPDLIGVRDRKYLDHTGTHRNRGPGDIARYGALVGFADSMEFGSHRMLTPAQRRIWYRTEDEPLHALAEYIYALEPPPNPNRFDASAAAGEKLFRGEGCAGCHTPPLYTNNKLTPALGFIPPKEHMGTLDILNVSVGTDPNLALRTRKGTGYYKVPSLKGVWYRRLFLHDGSLASLEDMFDARRLRDDYVPTGFKGRGVKTRAVPGHEFGLKLDATGKRNLVAFLRTL